MKIGTFASIIVAFAIGGEAIAVAQELRHNLDVDLPVTIGGLVTVAGSEVWLSTQDPLACRVCSRDNEGHDTLNSVDRNVRDALRWSHPHAADLISDFTLLSTALVAGGTDAIASAHDRRSNGIGIDLLLISEAAVVASNVNQLAKLIVLRERPFVHALTDEERATRTKTREDNLSFYSGHTTEAVSIAVAAGTVASLRGYRLAPLVWAASLPPALVTGYLRIGADRHYFTDVLTGAVTGALIGFLVPFVFHGRDATSQNALMNGNAPAIGQASMLGYSGAF